MLIILHLVIENGIGFFSTSSISRKKTIQMSEIKNEFWGKFTFMLLQLQDCFADGLLKLIELFFEHFEIEGGISAAQSVYWSCIAPVRRYFW